MNYRGIQLNGECIMKDKLVALIILDGFGINPKTEGNAIKAENKPNIDRLMKEYPNTIVRTSVWMLDFQGSDG